MQDTSIGWRNGRFKGWDCCFLQHGPLELALVPQVGGRIMGCAWRGHELFFTQPEREGRCEDLSGVQDPGARKRRMGMPLWGGDKTWLAPQSRWSDGVPFLDLDSGPFTMRIGEERAGRLAVEMTSAVCRETGMQIARTVTLSAGRPGWSVRHRLTNCSPSPAAWGIWGVSMMLRPGKVYLPRGRGSRFPDGVKTFAEEGESVAARPLVVGRLGDLAVIECVDAKKFKFGADGGEGWMLGVLETRGGLVGYRKSVAVDPHRSYAHGCVCEVYNSAEYPYLEMETHGPLVRLEPGDSFERDEEHAVFDLSRWPVDEAEVRAHAGSTGERG